MQELQYRKIIDTIIIESLFSTGGTMSPIKKDIHDIILHLVSIGFCQPKFYKPIVWKRAKRFLDLAVELKLATPCNFGRGKGKFTSANTIGSITEKIQSHLYPSL